MRKKLACSPPDSPSSSSQRRSRLLPSGNARVTVWSSPLSSLSPATSVAASAAARSRPVLMPIRSSESTVPWTAKTGDLVVMSIVQSSVTAAMSSSLQVPLVSRACPSRVKLALAICSAAGVSSGAAGVVVETGSDSRLRPSEFLALMAKT